VAKKSMIAKQKRTPKFKVQEYTLCETLAAVRTLLFVNLNFAVFVSVNLHIKDKFLALKKPAGNPRLWEGGY
jgi:small subunit ribosomal protein S14